MCKSIYNTNVNIQQPRIKPNVNYGLWVMTTCQYSFISYNKCIPQGWDVDSGEAVYMWFLELYLPLNFAVSLKLLLKIVY